MLDHSSHPKVHASQTYIILQLVYVDGIKQSYPYPQYTYWNVLLCLVWYKTFTDVLICRTERPLYPAPVMSFQCCTSCFVNVWRVYEKNNRIYDRLLSRVHLLSKYNTHFYLSFRAMEESYEFFSAVKDIALSFYSYWEIMNFPKSIST